MKLTTINKSILLIILLSSILISDTFGTDLLDAVKSNSKLVNDLKDIYRVYRINQKITEQKELINLLIDDNPENELKELLDNHIAVCETLKQILIGNDSLNSYVTQYLTLTIQSYKIAKTKGFNSDEFKKDFEKYKKEKEKYMDYIATTYSLNRFANLTEDKYWQTLDKKNYIKSQEYTTYQSLKENNLKGSLVLLDTIIKYTTDFQEYSIYQIELADQYVKHRDSLDNAEEIAISKYKTVLDHNKYCLFLFESWLKWRIVFQQNSGLSISSDIPNDEYDKIREQVAFVILDYITENEKDEMAINEFLLMATHDIVRRFGDYPYGNQNTVEFHELFDSKN